LKEEYKALNYPQRNLMDQLEQILKLVDARREDNQETGSLGNTMSSLVMFRNNLYAYFKDNK
jgi:hypothetical protein